MVNVSTCEALGTLIYRSSCDDDRRCVVRARLPGTRGPRAGRRGGRPSQLQARAARGRAGEARQRCVTGKPGPLPARPPPRPTVAVRCPHRRDHHESDAVAHRRRPRHRLSLPAREIMIALVSEAAATALYRKHARRALISRYRRASQTVLHRPETSEPRRTVPTDASCGRPASVSRDSTLTPASRVWAATASPRPSRRPPTRHRSVTRGGATPLGPLRLIQPPDSGQ